MAGQAPAYSIILAAGKGTRMQSASTPKVCFELDGIPAINRAVAIYNSCGILHHVVVVGAFAGRVVETIGREFPNASFVYQPEQRGTAHAVKTGLQFFSCLNEDPDILVVAGDRIIEPSVLEELFDRYYTRKPGLLLLATSRKEGSVQGRLIEGRKGDLLAIVEKADIRQRRAFERIAALARGGDEVPADAVRDILQEEFSPPGGGVSDAKLAAAFGSLWQRVAAGGASFAPGELAALAPGDRVRFAFRDADGSELRLSPAEADAAPCVNNCVYLARASTLQYALSRLGRDNAQEEEYLSDIVEILSHSPQDGKPARRCEMLKVRNPDFILGFNNPAELLEAEAVIKSRREAREPPELPASDHYRAVREWRAIFDALPEAGDPAAAAVKREVLALYGDTDAALLRARLSAFRSLLAHAEKILGSDQRVLLVRSPGRVNAMGRHVDHQGGNCNLMTIGFETLIAVHARNDDTIRLFNLDPLRFPEREFSIRGLIKDLPWDDWRSLVNSEKVLSMARTYGGDWSQYVMAPIVRLQKKFHPHRLRGMDMVVSGDIPMAAGLSSSSSLVVGTAEAAIAVSGLNTFPSQLVDLCGEGEWFVGTRGGSADHAAVKLGQKGKVIRVAFFDFAVEEAVPFPEDYALVVCDSGITAKKTVNAKDLFNHRVSCYHIGLALIRKLFPQYAPLIRKLRDVNVRTLRVPLSWIYRILLHLPEAATRDELRALLPEADLDQYFKTHQPPDDGLYPIRGVVLFGLAEFERARVYADLLKKRALADIGRVMNASHDGDRVAAFSDQGGQRPFQAPVSNQYLLSLMEDLESGDPDRVQQAQLLWQPGSYHCSHPTIDRMVDIALKTPGVLGAQLAGAGLGGCMMVLAHRDGVAALTRNLTEQYYAPAGQEPAILPCRPIAGSCVLMKDRASGTAG